MTVGVGPEQGVTPGDYLPGLPQAGGPTSTDERCVFTLPSALPVDATTGLVRLGRFLVDVLAVFLRSAHKVIASVVAYR